MASQLLTIDTELRLKICGLALLDTTITTFSIGEDLRSEEIIISNDHLHNPAEPSRSISLLLVCKQLHAEVSPIFHDHVRLHLSPWGCNDDWGQLDMGLRYFVLQDFLKAPRGVKRMSICTVLASQLTKRGTVKALEATFARALPHLQELIVYDERDHHDLDYDPKDKDAKQNAIAFAKRLYSDKDFDPWSPLHKLFPRKDRMFTVTQQLSLSMEEVSIRPTFVDDQTS